MVALSGRFARRRGKTMIKQTFFAEPLRDRPGWVVRNDAGDYPFRNNVVFLDKPCAVSAIRNRLPGMGVIYTPAPRDEEWLETDAFLGSGTTVIAAERTGRRCYGLELDPLYVDTIVRRWQKLTR
jgi:DNA methylase